VTTGCVLGILVVRPHPFRRIYADPAQDSNYRVRRPVERQVLPSSSLPNVSRLCCEG
jgi:hypothetical protein